MTGLPAVIARSSNRDVVIVGIPKVLTKHIQRSEGFAHEVAFAITREQAEAMGVPDLKDLEELKVELFVRPRGTGSTGLGIGESDAD